MHRPFRRSVVAALLVFAGACHAVAAADVELGKYLSSECVTCHRASAQATAGVPQIVGWPEEQFIAVMMAYRDKVRENPVMQTIAGRLGAEEIAALASYFGAIRRPASSNAEK